ncbi:Eaa1 [Klebsiella pneumoniae]|uniref:DUF551 domain-containing protein n=1 Tax=Klebsiella pneumoniae TaxID=573 RepID=UPI000E2D62AE|nr:DUF551 domain-containing protein [Klebsiella pneumoniae]SXP58831.1 Eaa1 [Klebsiella pneumoniae]
MTKSTITREQLLEIIETDHVQCGEASYLARMALAAMDSEPDCKERKLFCSTDTTRMRKTISVSAGTGDAPLYRHAQPVADSEPDRNPVLAYADSYRDMAKQGVESVPIWSVITDLERNIAPLYRHAQQPVVPEEWTIADAVKFCKETGRQDAGAAMDAWNACRAAMLQASPVCTYPSGDGSLRWPCPVHPGNSPAQSDCCPAQNHVSPEQNGDTPAQSQGWIQVSEQMPPSRHEVLVGRWWGEKPLWCCKWATYIPGHPDAQSSGWLIPGASWTPTHWMPLPAAPQEEK